jgi:thiamine-monophosphate kinase
VSEPDSVQTLRQIGEFGLINRIARAAVQGPAVLLGPGDDAAVLAAPDGRVVACTDVLVEGRHFRRDWSSGYDLGRKAAAQNLADIAAMGAVPTALLVGLVAPGDLPVRWAVDLAAGLADESAQVGASVAGGDTTRGDFIVVAVSALGDLQGRAPVTRALARTGEVVAYAGELGWSACGLGLLRAGLDGPAEALARHRAPRPPYAAGPAAARAGASAMIDVSDGLLADLGHIAEESAVAIDLDPAAFPVPDELRSAAKELGVDPLSWILTGGEDHALVACFPRAAVLPTGFRAIGTVVGAVGTVRTMGPAGPEGGAAARITVAGRPWPGAQGWDHFA